MNGKSEIMSWTQSVTVDGPLALSADLSPGVPSESLSVTVEVDGQTLIDYNPGCNVPGKQPDAAREPAAPEQIQSVEELYLTGVHLDQYHHATMRPEAYWQEALRRDPADSRSHNALGLWRLRRGEFECAAEHFEAAIKRLTLLNPNPRDGEPFYNLGVVRRYQQLDQEAYKAFFKATWNAAWRGPAFFALAEIEAKNKRWDSALNHVRQSLRAEADNLNARGLLCTILENLGDRSGADTIALETLAIDPMDIGLRWRQGIAPANGQERLDLAFDLLRAGLCEESSKVLQSADLKARDGSVPMILLTLCSMQAGLGMPDAAASFSDAIKAPLDYCFPSRLDELQLLSSMAAQHPECGAIHYLLGNILYSFRRHIEAIAAWEKASRLLPSLATVWRNLAIAYFNVSGQRDSATDAFERAFQANHADARILYERDQLWKRIGKTPQCRLIELLRYPALTSRRDDLSVELATLMNQVGKPEQALELLLHRKFQPWEGGEGLVLEQYVRARLLLGRRALQKGDASEARTEFHGALEVRENLGEATHPLADRSEIYYWLGIACERLGEKDEAIVCWKRAASRIADIRQMSLLPISEMTYWNALAQQRLGGGAEANSIFKRIYEYSIELETTEPKIDYFATSLPTMLLLNQDLSSQNLISARFLRAQGLTGLGRAAEAETLLREVLAMDANHSCATDLLDQMQMQGIS
jgi:tetratricopeptide (TPR) repeat protein